MSFSKKLIFGRSNGMRRRIFRQIFGSFFGDSQVDTSPDGSHSSPSYENEGVVVGGSSKMEPPRDVTPPEGFEVVIHKDSLNKGEMAEINIAGKMVLLLNVNDAFYAVNSSCPHAQGPLADGEIENGTLRCPFHGWEFNVTDGQCLTNTSVCLDTYETVIEGNAVCVKV